MYDVAIIGLGPAGATLARTLSPRLRAIAIDRKGETASGPGFRKPCGGLLAPDSLVALAKAGLTLPEGLLVAPEMSAVTALDMRSGLSRRYPRRYTNVDRHKFDLWLCSLIPPGVEIVRGARCTGVKREGGAFRVGYVKEGAEGELSARFVVGADGSVSVVRRDAFSAPIRRYVSIQEWYERPASREEFFVFFDESITDCYAWANNKGEFLVLGAALPAAGCKAAFGLLKGRLEDMGYFFGEPLRREACLVSRPSSPGQIAASDGGAFLAGEAGGFISPSSLEGISYAIETGLALGRAFNSPTGSPAAEYERLIRPIRLKLAFKMMKSIAIYNPAIRRAAFRSGIFSLEGPGGPKA